MNTPNNAGRITSRVALKTISKRSFIPNVKLDLDAWLNLRKQFSTMIMAPSTSKPKSKAPRLIKLALTLACTIPVIVISIAMGITAAVSKAARILPNKKNKIMMTNKAPSTKFA